MTLRGTNPFRHPRQSGDPGRVVSLVALDSRFRGNDDKEDGARRGYFSASQARLMRMQASFSASVEVA